MPAGLNPPDFPDPEGDEELLRAVAGEPTVYQLLSRVIELLEEVVANQARAMAADPNIGPLQRPFQGGPAGVGRYPVTPARYPQHPNNPPIVYTTQNNTGDANAT